jgi:hypothetical protein
MAKSLTPPAVAVPRISCCRRVGAFYSYFESKSDLYREVSGCFFTDPNWKSHWEGVDVDLASANAGPQIIRAYLSRQHFDDVENSCPMVALPSDVARGDEMVKGAFEAYSKRWSLFSVAKLGIPLRSPKMPPWPLRLFASAVWSWRDR